MAKYLDISEDELAELIRFSQESGEAIVATWPVPRLIVAKSGEKTLRKLAQMRGVAVD